MQAFIPAAGLGTRLRPLTDNTPKALVEIGGKTLLEHTIERVTAAGAHHIVINVHHHADQIINFIAQRQWTATIAISDEREALLDTGGGLHHAAKLMRADEPILIHNVDILSTIDLGAMIRQHNSSGAWVTLAVSRRDSSRQLLFDQKGQLVGWHNRQDDSYLWSSSPQADIQEMAYSGIAVVRAELPSMLPDTPTKYPIIPAYLDLSKNHPIGYFQHDSQQWVDIGRRETLEHIAQNFKSHGNFFA